MGHSTINILFAAIYFFTFPHHAEYMILSKDASDRLPEPARSIIMIARSIQETCPHAECVDEVRDALDTSKMSEEILRASLGVVHVLKEGAVL